MIKFSVNKNRPLICFVALLMFVSLFAAPLINAVQAAEGPAPVNVTLQVRGINDTIFDGAVTVESPAGDPQTVLDALQQGLDGEGITYKIDYHSWGVMVSKIDGDASETFGGWDGWLYNVNGATPDKGADKFEISAGDSILFYYSRWAAISTQSVITYGDTDPEVEVKLVGDEFTENAAEAANWEINSGATGLALDAIQKSGAQTVTLAFTGTAAEGTISIKAKTGGLGGEGDSNQVDIIIGIDKSQLKKAIDAATDLLDQAQVGDEVGHYPQSAVDEMQGVLDRAKGFYDGDEATREEINTATDELSEAITRFRSLEIKGDSTGLKKAIDDALGYYGKHKTLTSWWEMVALRGAGVNLRSGGWKLPVWTSGSLPADSPATSYAGFILGLLARGDNPQAAWGSRNLLQELAGKQGEDGSFGEGANNTIWGIIALRAAEHPFEAEKAVHHLLSRQLKDGGYTFFGDTGDPDLTAMALVALSGYKDVPGVKTAIENALSFLESIQLESGAFESWGSENSNTTAAVLTGLVSVGENIFSARWVKNPSIYEALVSFQLQDGSFSFLLEPMESDAMATSQSLLALGDLHSGEPAYFRLGAREDGRFPEGDHPQTGGMGANSLILGLMAVAGGLITKKMKINR